MAPVSEKKTKRVYAFRPADLLAVLLVLALAGGIAAVFFTRTVGQEGLYAEIYRDGVLVRTMPLSSDAEAVVRGRYRNTVTVRGGRIAVTSSDCPGEDCVHTGWISGAGGSIVCLPNRVEVRIRGGSGPDAEVR